MSTFHQIKLKMSTHNLHIHLDTLPKFGFKIHSRTGDTALLFRKWGPKKHTFGKNIKKHKKLFMGCIIHVNRMLLLATMPKTSKTTIIAAEKSSKNNFWGFSH